MPEKRYSFKKKGFSMKKDHKYTDIYFTEASDLIQIFTYNAGLKRRLSRYAERHPDLCRMTDDDELGGQCFEIQKGRFCFRLTEPYSKERREAASRYAKENNASDRLNQEKKHDIR